MAKKQPSRKLLLRNRKNKKSKSEKTQTYSKAQKGFRFTKTSVQKIAKAPEGMRHTYRDTVNRLLHLRVTSASKTFYWQKRINGKQKKVTIGRYPEINLEQARLIASDIAADYAKGTDVQQQRRQARDIFTLGDLWNDYRSNRKRKIRDKDSVALEYQWKKHFKKWENTDLSDITHTRARNMILAIRKGAPFHGNRIHAHGKAMFNHAIRELKWNGENPFDFAMASEKKRARKVRLRKADMPNFMKGLDACSENMKLLFLSSLYTGRRMGEVQSMAWADLDLKSGVWTLPETKSGEIQTALLPDNLTKLLLEKKDYAESPWVFPSPSKAGHVQEIKGAWAKVRKASGLHHLQARDLRRTFISWAQEAGVPIASVSAQVGHADIATTAKHYTVFSEEEKRKGLHQAVGSMVAAIEQD